MSRGRILSGASLAIIATALFLRPLILLPDFFPYSSGINVMFFAAVLAACILRALAGLFGAREEETALPFDSVAYLLLLVVGIGYLRSPDRAGAIDSFYPMTAALVAYLLASRFGFEQKRRDVLLTSLCSALVLVAIWGIYQYFYGLEELMERAIAEGWVLDELTRARMAMDRVYAGFVSPNALAGFILLLCPVLFCFVLKVARPYLVCLLQVAAIGCIICAIRMESIMLLLPSLVYAAAVFVMRRRISLKGLRVAGIVPVGVVLACLLFTGSKSGYIIFAISCFPLAALAVKKGKLPLLLGAVALVLVFSFTMYGADIGRRLWVTFGARIDYWRGAAGVIKEYHLLGSGLGSFWCEYQRYMLPGAHLVAHAHNSYLEIWAELGVSGLILFVAILALSIVRGLRGAGGLIGYGAAAGLIAFALHNVVDFDLYVPALSLSAFTVGGLLASSGKGAVSRAGDYILLGVCLVLLVFFGPRFTADQSAPELEWQMRDALSRADYEAAHTIVPLALRAGPRRAGLRVMLGDLFLRDGDTARAIDEYRAAVDSNPHWAKPHHALARAYSQSGGVAVAIDEARKAAELSPASARIKVDLGVLLAAGGRHDESLLEYRNALDLQRAVVKRAEIDGSPTLEKERAFLKSVEERLGGYERAE